MFKWLFWTYVSEKASDHEDDEPLPPGAGLDAFMALLLALVVAGWFGLFEGNDSTVGGPAGIGDDIGFLIFWIIKFLIIVGVCIALVTTIMGSIQGTGVKLAIYGGVAVLIAGLHFLSGLNDDRRQPSAQPRVDAAPQQQSQQPSESQPQLQRNALIAKYEQLSAEVPVRWREDLEAAGAIGKAGERPPMIRMTHGAAGTWQVTNLTDQPICVNIGRVLRDAGRWQRCAADLDTRCRELGRKATRLFVLPEFNALPACARGQLEFRVGTPTQPEPSWWTRSALDQSNSRRLADDRAYRDFQIDQLRGEVAFLESMITEQGRAARWRKELVALGRDPGN